MGLITKTWKRCKSIGRGRPTNLHGMVPALTTKSKSCPHIKLGMLEEKRASKRQVAPEGCFTVYVGPQKQRFVVKTEHANHPLFKMLLEEAESEFGYDSRGPLVLPCNVEIFHKVLVEMDDCGEQKVPRGWGLAKRYGSYSVLSPSRMVAINQF
ncbi:hypothetical protein ACFX13_012044 [Malus domestica]|uniref:Uncharacterized protein n=1 Tax=Malus baccata TaxID=106549 RepID=A0A540NDS1_MALBA|nr:indole-3-acetic acid-induced protein ARG7-like [Malus domestica]XP_050119579.1 indole-3-acetic acid-induced protein ARG7-like [Malus sylvestris]TQE09194.1 hypothetical protein C1H46_005129 [Malus baccata]